MDILILRPTFIWGPGCDAFETIIEKVHKNEFVWVNNGNIAFESVHVENAAEAVRLAVTNGKDKGIYFVTDDEETTVKNFLTNVCTTYGIEVPKKTISGFVARPVACVIETIWKIFKLNSVPPLTNFDLSFVSMPRRYNINKAKKELGYKPVISRDSGFKRP